MYFKGVVYCDFKCENVFLDKYYYLKVIDFGFVKRVLKVKNGEFKLSEIYCGSYVYVLLEILKGILYDLFFVDVWSMGVVFFIMLYGRFLFDDFNNKKLLK